ncbi:DUF1854 domain-containing protein [Ramlibacter sp. MAH-25]|jgi:hypothetical protein|uniref:DUF1854 domain-containing protein n=2 Tax=Comamonadaceae TaxID=80864 RepID=A0A6N8IXM9_9BURK|nr:MULTISPECIES: DUF1854 domain-containing protein [Ramlibacter]MBA2961792.1 DUF1854 domain-containing protein [Ramlibacter sp. CGMCC 1.13660]MVQ31734.1 DUF1854 domain-containing protein [Ramlibacter pinisoli]
MTMVRLERNRFGRLVLTLADGTVHEGVVPVRAFPLAAPEEGVSLVGAEGRELAWVPHLDELQPQDRALIDDELAGREFVPTVQRIEAVSSFSTPSTWSVVTDRGSTRFVLKGEEDIRQLGNGALLIASAEGINFRIADRWGLDRKSRGVLERFL